MFKKILCPIDFSKESYIALAKSLELAYYGPYSDVLMLHVAAPPTGEAPNGNATPRQKQDALAALQALFDNRLPPRVHLKAITKPGLLTEQLVQTAMEEQADLLVLPGHLDGVETAESLQQAVSQIRNTTLCSILYVGKTIESAATGYAYEEGLATEYSFPCQTSRYEKEYSTLSYISAH